MMGLFNFFFKKKASKKVFKIRLDPHLDQQQRSWIEEKRKSILNSLEELIYSIDRLFTGLSHHNSIRDKEMLKSLRTKLKDIYDILNRHKFKY